MRLLRLGAVLVLTLLVVSCAEAVLLTPESEVAVTTTQPSVTTAEDGSVGRAPELSLISFFSGTLLVTPPEELRNVGGSGYPAVNLFDDRPRTYWQSPEGVVSHQSFVVEMPQPSRISALGFDTASRAPDGTAAGGTEAKDISVEMSD